MFLRVILLSIVLTFTNFLFGQTTYFDLPGGGALPSGWVGTNNITGEPIDKGSYYMLQPGSPGDILITSSYDLCSHTSATLTVDIGSFGSGSHNALLVEVSLDGGSTYTQTYTTAATASSTETPITPINISPVSSTLVIRLSVNATSGRGIRMQNLKLVGNGSVSCGGGSQTVTFDGNGNDGGSMSAQSASSSTALTSNSFTQTGCTFTNWNTAANGSGTSYADGATYDFSADITLYAQWNCGSSCSSIFSDDFSGTLSQWSNTGDWAINSGELDHNLSGVSGSSYIYHDLGSHDLTSSDYEWSVCIRNGSWDPSGSNNFGYFLISDATNLLGTPNGYAVGVNLTGSSDLLTLYRVDAGVYTAIVTSAYDWNSSDDVCIRVTRASSGLWQLYYDSGSGETSAGTNTDNTHTNGQYTGSVFVFTSSRAGLLWIDDVNICGASPASNTITTGTVSGSPFSVECATDDNGTVTFTSTDAFGGGNVYTAQLSDASGNFGSPVDIGTLSSTANSGTINVTIPGSTVDGTGYKIRIVSSNPYIVGSESSAFTIDLTNDPCAPPHITSVMFNGCDPSGCGGEGRSEIVFANTGANSVLVNSGNLDLVYPGSPAYDLLGTIVSNSSTITTMNDSASCGTLFYDANGLTLPPNTTMLLLSANVCADVNFDWSGLCGQGPIYVVFGQGGTSGDTWHDSGNFGNSSGTKNFDLDITATDANTYGYTYTYVSGNQGDGEFATFSSTSPGGNATSTGVLADCNVTSVVLPITLIDFSGKKEGSSNLLYWSTSTEINNDYFTLEKSEDALHFEVFGYLNGAGNSNVELTYQLTDNTPYETTYYRLKQTDFDGNYSYSETIAIHRKSTDDFYYSNTNNSLIVSSYDESMVTIYNVQGQLIQQIKLKGENQVQIPLSLKSGFYIISLQSNDEKKTISKKIVITE